MGKRRILVILLCSSLCVTGCGFKLPFLSKKSDKGESVEQATEATLRDISMSDSLYVDDDNFVDTLAIDATLFINAYDTPAHFSGSIVLERDNVKYNYRRLSNEEAMSIVDKSDITITGMIVSGEQGIYVDIPNSVCVEVTCSDEITDDTKEALCDFITTSYCISNVQSGDDTIYGGETPINSDNVTVNISGFDTEDYIELTDENYEESIVINPTPFEDNLDLPVTFNKKVTLTADGDEYTFKRIKPKKLEKLEAADDGTGVAFETKDTTITAYMIPYATQCAIKFKDAESMAPTEEIAVALGMMVYPMSTFQELAAASSGIDDLPEDPVAEAPEDDNPIKDSPEKEIGVGNKAMKSFGLGGARTELYEQNPDRPANERFDFTGVVDDKYDDILITGKVIIRRGVLEEEYTPENGRGYLQFPKSQSYELERVESNDEILNWKYKKQDGKEELNGIFSFGYDLPKGKYKVKSGTLSVVKNPPRVQFDANKITIIPGEVVATYTEGQEFEITEVTWVTAKKLKLKE